MIWAVVAVAAIQSALFVVTGFEIRGESKPDWKYHSAASVLLINLTNIPQLEEVCVSDDVF